MIYKILIYKNPLRGNVTEEWLRRNCNTENNIMPTEKIHELTRNLIKDFIESMVIASNKRASNDQFQFLFQIQLAYTALVKLEYINQGGCKFLYLPKQVYTFFEKSGHITADGLTLRKHFEESLEPSKGGGQLLHYGYALQKAYIQQFYETVNSIKMQSSDIENILNDITYGGNINNICNILHTIINRDKVCKCHDVTIDNMKKESIYCCQFEHDTDTVHSICELYNINTVVDLRTNDNEDKEAKEDDELVVKNYNKKPTIIVSEHIQYFHIDIATMMGG